MNIKYMNSPMEQMKGLMFVKDIPFDLAVVFPFTRRKNIVIHTWFCKFPLDIGLIDENDCVSKLYKNILPFKIMPMQTCYGFVESRAGANILSELMVVQREEVKDAEDWKWRK